MGHLKGLVSVVVAIVFAASLVPTASAAPLQPSGTDSSASAGQSEPNSDNITIASSGQASSTEPNTASDLATSSKQDLGDSSNTNAAVSSASSNQNAAVADEASGETALTAASSDSQIYTIRWSQVPHSTQVNISLPNCKFLQDTNRADRVVIEATMNYGDVITRDIKADKELTDFVGDDPSVAIDFTTYGKFKMTVSFYEGDEFVADADAQTVGVTSNQYNIAPVSATLPVAFFSLSMWDSSDTTGHAGDIRHDADGNIIPTILMMERPASFNWSQLPDGVYSLPYLTKEEAETQPSDFNAASDKFRADAPAMQAYIHDLYEMDPSSEFNLYMVDYYLGLIQSCIYANNIPESQYTITVLSDGSGSYSIFKNTYTGSSVDENNAIEQKLEGEWKTAKQDAYSTGVVDADFCLWNNSYLYAVLNCETNIQWWLARPALLTTANDGNAFGKLVQADSKVKRVNIGSKLTNLKNQGADSVTAFKALYNFNDSYFAAAQSANKKVMLFLGTTVGSENGSFPDYAKFVMSKYGDEYAYYYKGHPGSPTEFYPSKQQELSSLGITDVDSSIPAELIIFFNPGIYLSGYTSSTYASVTDSQMDKVLFRETKEAAQTDGNNVSMMDCFVSDASNSTDANLKQLIDSGRGKYLVQFSDTILASADYSFALWDSTSSTLSYYKTNSDGSYTFVRSGDKGFTGSQPGSGAYTITGLASSNSVDIAAASLDDSANVQMWGNNTTPAQRFYLAQDTDGYYTITNINSGKALDVADAGADPGTNVQQYESNGTDAQKWQLNSCGDGTYNLVSKCNGLCLDVADDDLEYGANVQVYTGNGTNAQKFKLNAMSETVKSGTYSICSGVSGDSSKVLDICGGSLLDGAFSQIYSSNKTNAQIFNLSYDATTGYYAIENKGSMKMLDVAGGSTDIGANVWQYESNSTNAQKWTIVSGSGNSYGVYSALGGGCLDVSGGLSTDGAQVQIWSPNGTDAQAWNFNAA